MKNWILIIVITLAAVLRLWQLGSIPAGLTPDEAALGYNSYSILKTGKDEFGTTFPVIFKSFGDYKPGLYVYLDVPFVAIFGLSEFSTRLPSALAGILIVYLIYLLTGKLFHSQKNGNSNPAIAAGFIAALNPWLIYFSRGAWEANVSLSFTLLGIYFFLLALEKSKFLLISAFFFALTPLIYQGAKLSSVIVILILTVVYRENLLKTGKKILLGSFVLGLIITFPVILSLFNGQTQRLAIFSIFSYRRPADAVQTMLAQGGEKIGDVGYYLFHSEGLNYFLAIAGRWFNNFSGRFLFFEGDWANPVSTAPYQGVLLLADLIFIPLGLYAIFKKKVGRGEGFIILWLILAPFSAAISRDELNAVRDLNLAVPLVIIISLGLFSASRWLNMRVGKIVALLILFIFYLLLFAYFLDAYFIHVPAHNSNYWRYGYKQAVEYILPSKNKYKNIVFEQSFNQPYIYFLFFGPKDPVRYQAQEKLVDSQYIGDVGFEERIDNIEFKQIDWQVLKRQSGTLVITGANNLPPDYVSYAVLLKEIKYLNERDVAFDIVEIK